MTSRALDMRVKQSNERDNESERSGSGGGSGGGGDGKGRRTMPPTTPTTPSKEDRLRMKRLKRFILLFLFFLLYFTINYLLVKYHFYILTFYCEILLNLTLFFIFYSDNHNH